MNNNYICGLLSVAILLFSNTASSAPVYIDNQADYLRAIADLNKEVQPESFENNLVWSPRATPLTSVTSNGITWSSNGDGMPISTFDSFHHSAGQYHLTQAWNLASSAFWSEKSTNPDCLSPGNCGDGFVGSSTEVLYGVGGWIMGTAGSSVGVFLDGSPDNALGSDIPVGSNWTFVGVIDEAGFNSFEFREMEYVWESPDGGSWSQLRSDDFSFAVDNAAVVPVPAAVWLFGSGLLGLVGVARRRIT